MKDFDLRKYLAEGKLLKEDYESWPIEIQSLKDSGYDVKGDGGEIYDISKDGVFISRLYTSPLNKFEDIKTGKIIQYTGFADFIDHFSSTSSNSEGRKDLLDFFHFTKYVEVDEQALSDAYERSFESMKKDLEDEMDIEQIKKEWTYENGSDFLDTNEDKMSEYLGFEIDTEQMTDDYTMGDPKGVEFVHSDEDFERWMDEGGSFWN